MEIIIAIFIPFLGTLLGSLFVYFIKEETSYKLNDFFYGISSGVMISASIWSLLIPSLNIENNLNRFSFLPSVIGFIIGFLFMIIIKTIINSLNKYEHNKKKSLILSISVTLHNFPEGICVGIALLSAYYGHYEVAMASALVLAYGIAIQNIPEGAIISLPMHSGGTSKTKSFLYGVLSGIVEPIGAILVFLFSSLFVNIISYLLAFAAGTMVFVVIDELIPSSNNCKKNTLTLGFLLGFIIMMVLDNLFS